MPDHLKQHKPIVLHNRAPLTDSFHLFLVRSCFYVDLDSVHHRFHGDLASRHVIAFARGHRAPDEIGRLSV